MTPHPIVTLVADMNGVSVRDILGPTRGRQRVVDARWQVARVLRSEGMTTTAIGKVINRDHSTVCHILKQGEWDETPVFRTTRKAAQ